MRRLGHLLAQASTLALLATVSIASRPAQGSGIVTASQVGNDVVFSGSGTLNLTGITYQGLTTVFGGIDFGREMLLGANPTTLANVQAFGNAGQITAPSPFGIDLFTQASSGTGARFGIGYDVLPGAQPHPQVVVPANYTSATSLSGTSTFTGKTLASLGIQPGTHVWSWGSGASADTLTLTIVPEPARMAYLLAALGWLAALRRSDP